MRWQRRRRKANSEPGEPTSPSRRGRSSRTPASVGPAVGLGLSLMASQLSFHFLEEPAQITRKFSGCSGLARRYQKDVVLFARIILSAEPRTASGSIASAPDQGVREAFEHRDTMKTAQPSNAWMLTSTSRRLRDTEPRSAEPPPRSRYAIYRNPTPHSSAPGRPNLEEMRAKADPATHCVCA